MVLPASPVFSCGNSHSLTRTHLKLLDTLTNREDMVWYTSYTTAYLIYSILCILQYTSYITVYLVFYSATNAMQCMEEGLYIKSISEWFATEIEPEYKKLCFKRCQASTFQKKAHTCTMSLLYRICHVAFSQLNKSRFARERTFLGELILT